MAISIGNEFTGLGIGGVDTTIGSGGIYRVGTAGIVVSGNRVAAFDDSGVIFAATDYENGTGLGLGRINPHHVHDNGDGTFNIYYVVYDADPLPAVATNWMVTMDMTGAATGPAVEFTSPPFHNTGNSFIMSEFMYSLPNGNIFHVDVYGDARIITPLGVEVTDIAPLGGIGETAVQNFAIDVTLSNDRIFYTWVDSTAGEAGGTYMQVFNMDGTEFAAPQMVSDAAGSGFGMAPSVQCETLSDGRVVVVWVDAQTQPEDTSNTSVWFKIYNADGTLSVDSTIVNTITNMRQDTPVLFLTESGFVVGYSVLDFAGTQEGRLREYDNDGVLQDTITGAYNWGVGAAVRVDNNTAFVLDGNLVEVTLPGADGPIFSGSTSPSSGNDLLTGTVGNDTLDALAGNDTVAGLGGDDSLIGGAGADMLDGGDGNDTLSGGTGDDTLSDGVGDDLSQGGDGNDLHIAGLGGGSDHHDGGAGFDTLLLDLNVIAPNQFTVFLDLVTGDGGAVEITTGRDTYVNMEGFVLLGQYDAIVTGGSEANKFETDSGNDTLRGGGGNDTLLGGAGDDTLDGGAGADAMDGGAGRDVVSYESATRSVRVDLQNDAFMYNDAVGDTFANVEVFQTGGTVDQLRGDAGGNEFYTGGLSDRLYGRAGDDMLFGETGADALYGGTGADTMTGGDDAGRRDRYIYFNMVESGVGSGNRDVITDFVAGEDRIEISRFDADLTQGFKQGFSFVGDTAFSGAAGELRFEQTGGNTIVQADVTGDGLADFEIELTGLMALTSTDFLI